MCARKISARELREKQSDIFNRVAYGDGDTDIIVTRHGKDSAVLISIKRFELMKKAMEYLEDESDIEDAKKAIEEVKSQGSKPLKQLTKELGLDV